LFAQPLGSGGELCPLEPWQAEEFADHVTQARAHLAPWIPFATRVVDVDSARELLQRYADKQARDAGRLYGIWLDGDLVGGTLFRAFDAGAGVCEVGVWLAPQAEGRGLVTRAVRHMLDWAIHVRGIRRVEWRTDPNNARSRAVAQRLGMTLDGVLRSSFVLNGTRRDTEVWSLLAHEWRPATTQAPRSP
jgi:ribosomal-protein-serine acetyltransferase